MNRRSFLWKSSGLVFSALLAPTLVRGVENKLDRIGMGTVLFRSRFKQTKPAEVAALESELTLLQVPSYYRDRFRLRNVEFWSYHFESLETDYLSALRRSLEQAGATLVNVQVDTNYNLASADQAERRRSIEEAKRWIDAAAFLGSKAIRINPGNGPVENSIASLRLVNAYAKSKQLPLLTENHFGIEMDPDVHLRIRQEAGPENIHTLPDFGNYPDESRYAALEKILPYAYLISAKASRFTDQIEHVSFDFDRCVQMAEQAGFRGIYSVEQWSREYQAIDYEKVGDWLIEHVSRNIRPAA